MGVVVVLPPDDGADVRGAVVADARVRVVDLGDVPALSGDDLRLDRFHFSAGGHSRAADAIAPAVLQLVHAAELDQPMTTKGPANPERSFGVSVGLVLCAIAAVALVARPRDACGESSAAIGGFLLIAGLVHAPLLKYPSAAWWKFSRALGYVNARILLTILFTLVLVPLSLVWRLMGKDPLSRRRRKWPGWSAYPSRYRDRKHYERMY